MMRVILILALVYAVHSSAIETDVIEIESSKGDQHKEGKFIFAATVTMTVTSFTSTVTSISVTQRFCFTTTANVAATLLPCQVNNMIPGRKKRSEDIINDLPHGVGMFIDGEEADFKAFVAQRLSEIKPTQREAKKHTVEKMEFRRVELVGGPDDCFSPQSYGRMNGRSDPRFITFRTTVTVSTASTLSQTQSGATVQSIILTDSWGGVQQIPASAGLNNVFANSGGCWPISLLSTSLSITACG